MITDPRHLVNVVAAMHNDIDQLARLWLAEQHAANSPHSGTGIHVSGGSRSDPTAAIAADTNRERDLNYLGSRIRRIEDDRRRELDRLKPRRT